MKYFPSVVGALHGSALNYVASVTLVLVAFPLLVYGQTYDGAWVSIPAGTFTMGEAEVTYQGSPGSYDAPLHSVTLSAFRMSATEVTNTQYVAFLNAALQVGLVEVREETAFPPDIGFTLVYGTSAAPSAYRGMALLNLSGTRVMKDHDDADGDGDAFTGDIEPENPLNLTYIGYDEARPDGEFFYVKDPRSPADFDWNALTDYYDYTNTPRQLDQSSLLNDYADWTALADYPNNLPTQADVQQWPATFIRWYGAKAFALFYGFDLPTEAEWEYAAQGGANYTYATADGAVVGDGSSANWNHLGASTALGHVLDVYRGHPNPYGLYNMAGNVWEWVADTYDAAFYTDAANPVSTADTGTYVRRGGSWNYHQATLKTAARARDEAFKGNDHFGFRVVDRAVDTKTEAVRQPVPEQFVLEAAYPNPFSGSTTMPYYLPESGVARMVVYDMLGRSVAVLAEGMHEQGAHSVDWNGQDASRHDVSPGLYVYRLESENHTMSRTIVLVR